MTEPARFTRLAPAPADGLTAADVARALAPEPARAARSSRSTYALTLVSVHESGGYRFCRYVVG